MALAVEGTADHWKCFPLSGTASATCYSESYLRVLAFGALGFKSLRDQTRNSKSWPKGALDIPADLQ